ncbi:hypothetical protein CEN50_04125 [Fischerella thermalis CCMEE 5268]|uniref:Uncharacterized protein n=1 Tax=Fischerella thermalis CCMEE 5268 TaxID=2019662 RepID=A0A2N6KKK8_9CYAN|nr:hypothetical protein CEN50_04125 [Fischerella thermalis CCMEE 5268]
MRRWGTRGPHDRQGAGIRGSGEMGRWRGGVMGSVGSVRSKQPTTNNHQPTTNQLQMTKNV